jgi:hypothetical protein
MKVRTLALLASMAGALAIAGPVEAKGCAKGAVVGGAAGHVAGHHGLLGAGAGCLIGRHQAKKAERQQEQQQQQQQADQTAHRDTPPQRRGENVRSQKTSS